MIAHAIALCLAGCAATKVADDAVGEWAKGVLESSGLKKPEAPKVPELPQSEVLQLPRKVALRIHAAQSLNHDASDRSLSLLVRIYKLKGDSAFLQAPYEAFANGNLQVLGGDVIESREVVLVPGQRYEVEEKLPRQASTLGVVAFFNAPIQSRWKFAFDAASAERTGLLLGAHGCGLTVTVGKPKGIAFDPALLGGSRCAPAVIQQ